MILISEKQTVLVVEQNTALVEIVRQGDKGNTGATGATGATGPQGATGATSYLSTPNNTDRPSGYVYFGWSDIGSGQYLIRRRSSALVVENVTGVSAEYSAKWASRITLF